MNYNVHLLPSAKADILDIFNYVRRKDSPERAENLFNQIKETCFSLSNMPNRGHKIPELETIGSQNYQEIHYKPYRIVYEVRNNDVFIICVFDDRQNVEQLLRDRLMR